MLDYFKMSINPVGICLLKVNNRNTRIRFEICSKLTIKTCNFEHINADREPKVKKEH